MAASVELRTRIRVARIATLVTVLSAATAFAQTEPRPGFNLFTVDQDIEIGRQSAAQAERQLPVMNDPEVERYLNAIVQRLAQHAPGARYPYQARVVDAREINAFSLPGGFLYVNRGLVEATRNESELAGVIAHEMGHVAMRHGTHQASQAYAAQAGLGILGGLLGRNGGNTGNIINAIGGLGLNAAFLKFSRNAEYEADLVGARMMRPSGYPPSAMANFFDVLRQEQQRDPSRLEQFFSDHPPAADRATRIRAESDRLGPVSRPGEVGGYEQAKEELHGLPTSSRRTARISPAPESRRRGGVSQLPRVEAPSSRLREFEQRDGFFSIEYPSNWVVHEADQGYGAVIAPEGGILQDSGGGQDVAYGIVINHYEPFDRTGEGTLQDATDDLVAQIRRTSSYLRPQGQPERRRVVDGSRALSVDLVGRDPATGLDESVTVVTRQLPDGHIIYALLVAPQDDAARLRPVYSEMLDSLRVNDRMAHR